MWLAAASAHGDVAAIERPVKNRIAEHFGKLPLSFEINKGQMDQTVRFMAHGTGYDLFLTPTAAVLRVQKPPVPQVDRLQEPGNYHELLRGMTSGDFHLETAR